MTPLTRDDLKRLDFEIDQIMARLKFIAEQMESEFEYYSHTSELKVDISMKIYEIEKKK